MQHIWRILIMVGALTLGGCKAPLSNESTSIRLDSTTTPPSTSNIVATDVDSSTTTASSSDDAVAAVDEAGACGNMVFEDWSTWTQVNDDLLRSEAHGNQWVDIFVNELAEGTYLSADAPYAECSAVAKSSYRDEERNQIVGLGIMVKMPAGYDPGDGDWWYGRFAVSGSYAFEKGKIDECIVCHREASETDYMFSKEVLQSITE